MSKRTAATETLPRSLTWRRLLRLSLLAAMMLISTGCIGYPPYLPGQRMTREDFSDEVVRLQWALVVLDAYVADEPIDPEHIRAALGASQPLREPSITEADITGDPLGPGVIFVVLRAAEDNVYCLETPFAAQKLSPEEFEAAQVLCVEARGVLQAARQQAGYDPRMSDAFAWNRELREETGRAARATLVDTPEYQNLLAVWGRVDRAIATDKIAPAESFREWDARLQVLRSAYDGLRPLREQDVLDYSAMDLLGIESHRRIHELARRLSSGEEAFGNAEGNEPLERQQDRIDKLAYGISADDIQTEVLALSMEGLAYDLELISAPEYVDNASGLDGGIDWWGKRAALQKEVDLAIAETAVVQARWDRWQERLAAEAIPLTGDETLEATAQWRMLTRAWAEADAYITAPDEASITQAQMSAMIGELVAAERDVEALVAAGVLSPSAAVLLLVHGDWLCYKAYARWWEGCCKSTAYGRGVGAYDRLALRTDVLEELLASGGQGHPAVMAYVIEGIRDDLAAIETKAYLRRLPRTTEDPYEHTRADAEGVIARTREWLARLETAGE